MSRFPMSRFYVSAAHKSSGKTTLSLGLARAFRERGRRVQTLKKGPDYIDPLWLDQASGRPCFNLDFNLHDAAALRAQAARRAAGADLCLIEGNKGLFDGMATDGSDSNAALAALLQAPVVLVVDTQGMTRGVAPLLLGYAAFGRELSFAGVVLNKVAGPRHAGKLRAAVETYTDLPVLGCVPRHPDLAIAERHLGLIPSNEAAEAEAVITRIAARVADHVDLDAIEAAAGAAPPLPPPPSPPLAEAACPVYARPLRIGMAMDAAFGFYYADDLEELCRAGADIVPIDMLHDQSLPEGLDGLVLGGGFPETHLATLAANRALLADLRRRLANGLPCHAECGGLMLLARSIRWQGESGAMAGLIPADAVMHDRPQGRGYVRLRPTADAPWPAVTGPDGCLRAHEFHHSRLEGLPAAAPDGRPWRFAYTVERGEGIDGTHDGLVIANTVAAYAHQRGTWATAFAAFARAVTGG